MTDYTSVRLAGKLRAAAEAFFRTDLGDVVLHYGEQPREFGADACALGSHVYLPVQSRMAPLDALELLGHELAHVVQQRQGRVRPAFSLCGYPANDDPSLEREAIQTGRRFAHGIDSRWPHFPVSAVRNAVVQRSVTVGGKALAHREDSTAAGSVLDLIDGGSSWLGWAVRNPSVNYHYADEGALLVGMQSGLHGADLILLRGLGVQLHPFKLLEMQPADLKVVATAENEADPKSMAQMQARKVLAKYQLLSQTELAIGTDFLTQTGVAGEPVFQGLTLSNRIALFNLVDEASSETSLNPMIQKEAAAFAVAHAQTPSEFVDYYQYYIASVDDPAPAAKGAAARSRKAETARESIEPLLYGNLFCPAVQGVPAPEQMNVIIQNWVAAGNDLGFTRLSLALAQVCQYANLKGATGEAASKMIEQYIEQAQLFIPQRPATSVTLTQDGLDRYYVYDNKQALAQVCLASSGNITLANYQPRR
jgi:uncharacterized protein DUF4157